MRVETDLVVEYIHAAITSFWVENVRIGYEFCMLKWCEVKG